MRFQTTLFFIFAAISASIVCGQSQTPTNTSSASAIVLKRESGPNPANLSSPQLFPYDFAGQLQELRNTNDLPQFAVPSALTNTPISQTNRNERSDSGVNGVPKDFVLKSDVPLSPPALEAVRVSEKWRSEDISPLAGSDGRVIYSFGAGLPTVVCAPLRVCIIELQPGEKLEGEPQIGDSVRWNLSPAMYGNGDQTTAVIVLKPQVSGLDTNLLITTDRRPYYIRLISKPQDYISRVAFQYPNDESRQKWQEQVIQQRQREREARKSTDVTPAMIAIERMNFDYRIAGGNERIRPVRVFDDGAKTYIQMPAEIQNRGAPVLLILAADGKGEMSNYRVRERTYIVDRLFDRAELVLGSGKKAQKVEIARVAPRG
jgi:type IV secretion system protein TrbG